ADGDEPLGGEDRRAIGEAAVELLLQQHLVVPVARPLGEDGCLAFVDVVVAGAEAAAWQVGDRPVRLAADGFHRARLLASRAMTFWAPMMKISSSLICSQAWMKWLRGRSYPRWRGGSSVRSLPR